MRFSTISDEANTLIRECLYKQLSHSIILGRLSVIQINDYLNELVELAVKSGYEEDIKQPEVKKAMLERIRVYMGEACIESEFPLIIFPS